MFRVFRAVIGCWVLHGFRPSAGTKTRSVAARARDRASPVRAASPPRRSTSSLPPRARLVSLSLFPRSRRCSSLLSAFVLHCRVCVHCSFLFPFDFLFLCAIAVLRFRVFSIEQSARVSSVSTDSSLRHFSPSANGLCGLFPDIFGKISPPSRPST